jgi:hypothetical protein
VVALPLTAMSSQFVIGSFEARFFAPILKYVAIVAAHGHRHDPPQNDDGSCRE